MLKEVMGSAEVLRISVEVYDNVVRVPVFKGLDEEDGEFVGLGGNGRDDGRLRVGGGPGNQKVLSVVENFVGDVPKIVTFGFWLGGDGLHRVSYQLLC
jgi:hypothetical protein